ncbi:MAG: efflux RND transporter periplasmic adaptor subunit [Verrucomicrobiales bacterium]|nr:efflux RND transporter periplasmic adaptor subunit [Verrucomicrobiales bacterium]
MTKPVLRTPLKRLINALALLTLLPASPAAQDDVRPVIVTSAERSSGVAHTFSMTGTVTSPRRSNLSSRTEGLVARIDVDAGSIVKKGDVLVQLDTKLAELDLELIDAEIGRAEIEMAEAKRRVEEVEKLTETGGFAKSQALTLETDLSVRGANLKQLGARRNQQLERIARHQLVAPFDGVIGRKLSETGEWVTTGTPVLELIEMKGLRFDIQIPQEFLGRINEVGKVSVKLDAFPEEVFDAELSAVIPVKNAISRTFLTRLNLIDPDGLAGPGMSGSATIESRPTLDHTVQVPRDAVVRFPDGTARVWVVENNGPGTVAKSRVIETAGKLGEMAEIRKGLTGGETVILKGNEGLREHQKVKVMSSSKVNQTPAP